MYLDPWAGMPDFCCDQDVIYDRARDLILWYRQGTPMDPQGDRFLLSASADGGNTWFTYSVRPGDLANKYEGWNFDYPILALSNDFLYIQTGLRGSGSPILLRWPLDELRIGAGFSYFWWATMSNWACPVMGSTDTMYFGDHQGGSNFRIYWIPETSNSMFHREVKIPSWSLQEGDTCPSLDGQNWCVRSASYMRGGWVSKGQLGFMWHATSGGGFPYPYINAAVFDQATFKYLSRPYIWSPNGAWQYPFVYPNARGDLGVVAYYSSPNSYPSPSFLIYDDVTPAPPPGWEAHLLRDGAAGAIGWGDYTRLRAFQPSQLGWAASVYSIQLDSQGQGFVQPEYFVVARIRDLPTIFRYWNS